MAEYLIQDTTLDAIADAINAKTGRTAPMTPVDMVSEIQSIQTGGEKVYTKLGEATVTEAVNALYITMTEQMKSCEVLYLINDAIVLSAEDWLYPNINGDNFGFLPKATNCSQTVMFAPIKRAAGITKCAAISQESRINGSEVAISMFQKIGVNPYDAATTIQSGKIEIWGYV